ncbi:hypothetical protein FBUS_05852 [Fasciolopsis buskii]|uniref:Uncharacterized protein n=1 Tax=Fasciolopsis buskii TaxID=27845 RepID=A0A8E0VI86_9TREM|nr:hypothetical protein FBUS_05852 [Fasciolopsis buski]
MIAHTNTHAQIRSWHLPVWIALNIFLSACVLFLAIFAWSSYLFHSAMIITQLLTIAWNGACYYLDVYPVEIQRDQNLQLCAAGAGVSPAAAAVATVTTTAKTIKRPRSISCSPSPDKNNTNWSGCDRLPNSSSPTCASVLLLPTDAVLEVDSPRFGNGLV